VALRLIQVGLGGWGRDWSAQAIPMVSEVERVAVVDSDPVTLAKAQAQFELADAQCFTDLDVAMDAVDARAVLVTAPLAAHAPLALQALEAGRHVLVEKPFAPTVDEARAVVDYAQRHGLIVMVSQNYRFFPAARTAARLVAERYVGPVGLVRVDFRKWSNRPAGGGRHQRLGHPLLYDMAIHHFDLMRMVLGQEPVQVYAHPADPPWSGFAGTASAALTITFDGGAVVSYRGSWVSSGTPTTWTGDWHVECETGEIFWTGRSGGVAGSTDGDVVTVRHLPGARKARPKGAVGAADADGYEVEQLDPVGLAALGHVGRAGVLAEFARAVADGGEPESSGRANLASLAVSEAAVRSTTSGQVEPVTWTSLAG
jgi:predicted dehydrogenase